MSTNTAPAIQNKKHNVMTRAEFLRDFVEPGMAIILRGAPGSGKSTVVDALLSQGKYFVEWCSADHHRMKDGKYVFNPAENDNAHGGCMRDFVGGATVFNKEDSVLVVDNTNVMMMEAAPYFSVAKAFGWKPVLVTVLADPETAASRNTHNVPSEKVRDMAKRIEDGNRHVPHHWTHIYIQG